MTNHMYYSKFNIHSRASNNLFYDIYSESGPDMSFFNESKSALYLGLWIHNSEGALLAGFPPPPKKNTYFPLCLRNIFWDTIWYKYHVGYGLDNTK